jgi:hypothetical protein
MKIQYGEMWDTKADLYLVTANATVDARGRAAMSAGAALEGAIRFNDSVYELGHQIKEYERKHGTRKFGVLLHPTQPIGIFQVKWDWWDNADLELIENSAEVLRMLCKGKLKGKEISLNYPGIGFGNRKPEEVEPYITCLPDSVTVWRNDVKGA